MIEKLQSSHELIIYDSELLANPSAEIFNPQYWQAQQQVTGSAQGRGTTWFIQLEKIQAALRHYRRGGLFGKLVKDHYWFSGWDKSRSVEEFHLLHHLKDAGVHVPRPVAARVIKKGIFYQADLLSERIPNAQDLVGILKQKSLSSDMYRKIGREIAKMHAASVNHTDLNIHNILIDDQEQVWIIDFDKCFVDDGDGWKPDNLARLKRSFEKELAKCHLNWKEPDLNLIRDGYSQPLGSGL
ncbi:3-deoxy-D-manno-octulosonic acid kinase [Vibrio quintilis]|uniref:3-deoxy-D-manno-octulosonic acid kinase n=1 Tax=Vibrio quintilis TaxID=1117707 RepID=A0A1M7YYF1_9VIBR|nr:3-deoxy-D-manno-octulosonic acid kinase [Vibrio quintilis]SHO57614.1 3-deoxy-D-manno-octulosonic acid kinase [Vibrio quintilis]